MDHEERTPILKEPLSGYQDLALSARLKMFSPLRGTISKTTY